MRAAYADAHAYGPFEQGMRRPEGVAPRLAPAAKPEAAIVTNHIFVPQPASFLGGLVYVPMAPEVRKGVLRHRLRQGVRTQSRPCHNVVASGTGDGVVAASPGHVGQKLGDDVAHVIVMENVLLVGCPAG